MHISDSSVVDFRVRPPYGEFLTLSIMSQTAESPNRQGVEKAPSYREESFDLFVDEMADAGIDVGVVMGRQCGPGFGSVPNDTVAEIVRKCPEKLVAFGGIDPYPIRDAVRETRRCIEELGMRGIVMDPGALSSPLSPDSRIIYPVYERCEELGVPVALGLSALIGPNISYSDPRAVHTVAQDFPDLTIILSHACWPWVMQVLGVLYSQKNVYMLPDFYMNVPGVPGGDLFVDGANYFAKDQLLYGSAYPVRPMKESLAEFRSLRLRDDVVRNALSVNPRRVLGL